MKKLLAVAVVLFLMALAPSFVSAGQLTFTGMKFFEKGDADVDYSQRVYTTRFAKSNTRYVACEVSFTNSLYMVRDQYVTLTLKYYKSDGSLFGETNSNSTIKSEWSHPWISRGLGWSYPGNWSVGTYRVEAFLDGVYIGQSSFTVYDDIVHLRFKSVSFFESGHNTHQPSPSELRTQFPKSTTRYINVYIDAENLLYGVRAQSPLIIAKYYNPDGSFKGEARIDTLTTPSDWYTVQYWVGWGWNEPGNWSVGTYRVAIYFGNKYVGQGYFTITY